MTRTLISGDRLSFALGIALASSAFASDWPQWRGPARDGLSTETGLLKSWPRGGPPLRWKAAGLGQGYSSVSIAQGRIFTMGDGADSSCVRAFSEQDGTLLWSASAGRPGGGGGYPGPRCTPTVDADRVYAIGQDGQLVCLEAGSGNEKWRLNLAKDLGGRMMSGWGYAESPLVDGEKLVCTPGGSRGTVAALNKHTGEVIWRSTDLKDPAAYSSVVVVELGGQRQYVQLTGASLSGLAADDGQLLWRADRSGRTAVIPTPIVHGPLFYVTSGYGVGCNLFEVAAASGNFSAREVYANRVMVNHHGGVVRVGDHVYGYSDGKGWSCQELKTGEALWSEKSLGKGALTYADGHLYLRSEGSSGTVALVEATPQAYREKGRFDQPDRSGHSSWPHPVVANGTLYLRDQDVLLAYDIRAR